MHDWGVPILGEQQHARRGLCIAVYAMQCTYLDCIVCLHAPCYCGSIWPVPTLILLPYLLLDMPSLGECLWQNTLTFAVVRFGTVSVTLSASIAVYR